MNSSMPWCIRIRCLGIAAILFITPVALIGISPFSDDGILPPTNGIARRSVRARHFRIQTTMSASRLPSGVDKLLRDHVRTATTDNGSSLAKH